MRPLLASGLWLCVGTMSYDGVTQTPSTRTTSRKSSPNSRIPEAETSASAPSTRAFDTKLSFGFMPLQQNKIPSCDGLAPSDCRATAGCTEIFGHPINAEKRCKEPSTLAGCTSMECYEGAFAVAKDPAGVDWWFASYCFPETWTELKPDGIPGFEENWPNCP